MTKRWYIVQVYSNFEIKVAETITREAERKGISYLFEEILIPKEEVAEIRRGKKVISERKFFPGYILVKMEMTDAAHLLIKDTSKVTGFLGANNKPQPISEKESNRILNQVEKGVEDSVSTITFEVGEEVKVSEGPFASFSGFVDEIDDERKRLKVSVSIFGRATPVELEYTQVEKVTIS